MSTNHENIQKNAKPRYDVMIMVQKDGLHIDSDRQEALDKALLHAVRENDVKEIIRLVRKEGANINARFEEGQTLLILAITHDRKGALKVLLNLKADPNLADDEGWTALHHAACQCDEDQINNLIDHGAKINQPNNDMQTPMHIAAMERGPGIIRTLVARGAKLSPIDRFGDTPLDLARKNDKDENAEALSLAESLRGTNKIMRLSRAIKKRRPRP